MAFTFYNSNPDGTLKDPITSGQLGALFSQVTPTEAMSGATTLSKVHIRSSEDVETYIGLEARSAYDHTVFVSANYADAEADLTGSETRYGGLEVVSATATEIIVNEDSNHILVRVGDGLVVENILYPTDSRTDNGDGTITLTSTSDFSPLPTAGGYVTSTFPLTIGSTETLSFWRERIVAPSAVNGGTCTVDILIGKWIEV